MVDPKVKKWVVEQQARGYSLEEIRDFLIKQGYSPDAADEAVGSVPVSKPEPEPEQEGEAIGKLRLKPFGKPKFQKLLESLGNRKAIPLIIAGAVLLVIILGVVISSLSERGTADGPPETPQTADVPGDSEGTGLDAQPGEGAEPAPIEPAPEDPNECDAVGESAACDDGNASTYDHCFNNTTVGLRQCAHIFDPIGGFDLEKARGLAIDSSDLLDFCGRENVSNTEAYPDWNPESVALYNAEQPKACLGYPERWCKGWLVECIVNQTRKIAPVYAMKIPSEDSYVVSESQIVELPVEDESTG